MVIPRATGGALASLAIAMLTACNLPTPPESTGGVFLDDAGDRSSDADGEKDAGAEVDADEPAPKRCDRALVIVASDYISTNIVISRLDGATLSGSFVSSAAQKPGLAFALSGDVDVPRMGPSSKRVVLIDRFGTNVLTWMGLASAEVLVQLPIGQGFESNPHDYVEVDERRAFVSRYESNMRPGKEPFDEGGDLLIVDTLAPAIIGRIAMPEENPALLPRPSGIARLGEEVIVTLQRFSLNFDEVGDGRFVGVSPSSNEVVWIIDIPGYTNCGRVAVSPSGERLAISCSGKVSPADWRWDVERSGVVIFDATTSPPKELERFALGKAFGAGIQPTLTFASETQLLGTAYGGNDMEGDIAFSLDIATGEHRVLAASEDPYSFGGVYCGPGCGDICILADAKLNRLRRWHVDEEGTFEGLEPVTLETIVGLPPRTIGAL